MDKGNLKYAVKITLIYFIIGSAWILLSDKALAHYVSEENLLTQFQTYKGWFFIVVTSLILFSISNNFELQLKEKIRELKNANHDLKWFFYKTSHDIRGPIASILGLAEIKEHNGNQNYPEIIQKIEYSASKADVIIHKLIRLTNILKEQTEIENVQLQPFIEEITSSLFKEEDDSVNIRLTINLEVDQISSDKDMLEAALYYIIENAIQYRDPDSPSPAITISSLKTRKGTEVTITDNGIGIAKDQINKAFDMFHRGTDLSQGSGLGLYIAKSAVNKLGGTITIRSSHGNNTTVSIFFHDRK